MTANLLIFIIGTSSSDFKISKIRPYLGNARYLDYSVTGAYRTIFGSDFKSKTKSDQSKKVGTGLRSCSQINTDF